MSSLLRSSVATAPRADFGVIQSMSEPWSALAPLVTHVLGPPRPPGGGREHQLGVCVDSAAREHVQREPGQGEFADRGFGLREVLDDQSLASDADDRCGEDDPATAEID